MSLNSVVNPIPFFSGIDGKALESGSIYVGQENANPKVSPVAVYWDAALTQPAAQPIRTIGGRPSRAGAPSKIYVSELAYSISAYDRKGALVLYEPSINASTTSLGDQQSIYAVTTVGQLFDLRKGTSANPDTSANPLLKVTRTVNIPKPGSSDRGEELAAIYGLTVGTTDNEAQTVGVYGGARSDYPLVPTNVQGDACGLYGVARTANYGTAIGAFVTGRRDSANGKATGLELAVQNYGAAATWNSTGYSQATGIWSVCLGDYDSAVAFNVGNPFGKQFEVGIGFTGQVADGKTGGVSGYSIRDAGNATYSIKIEGVHTTALAIGVTAGNVTIGQDGPAGATTKLFVKATSDTMSPLIVRGNSATQSANLLRVESSAGLVLFQVQASGLAGLRDQDFIPRLLGSEMGTASQSGFLHMPTSNGVHTGVPSSIVTGNVPMVYDRASNKIGVYNGGWKWTAALI